MNTELHFYNTLTRQKERFQPQDPKNVRLYVCGPTVYDRAHIGNARPAIVFDTVFRVLRQAYGFKNVQYVRNLTDIDDKINARAALDFPDLSLNEAIRRLTEETADQYHMDVRDLGNLDPTLEPRATEHVPGMIRLIETLVAKDHAYEAEGHVLFHVPSMPDYGEFARRSQDEMQAGARVEVAPYKRDPMDFVLWKPSSESEPGWDSPWGRGRPGWHIECSAMSFELLGEVFDIHGGGIDLVFPHHENEIAQSRCAHGTERLANVWMHNGFLLVNGEKMSKSLGNFFTIRDLLDDWPGEALRLTMLKTQYRQPINWLESSVRESRKTLDRWYSIIGDRETYSGGLNPMLDGDQGILQYLADDLNTPEAITQLHVLSDRAADDHEGEDRQRFKAALNLLGLGQLTETKWRAWRPVSFVLDPAEIETAIAARLNARAEKNWSEADRIRDELGSKGIQLKDAKDPETGEIRTTWELVR
ncbi:MAG: cysteine--tRNA ligase [Pseudomonadota bacterium]